MFNNYEQVEIFIKNITIAFQDKKISTLRNLTFQNMLKRKNPYLYKTKNLFIVEEIVKAFLDPFLSASEETIFGNSLEDLAIYTVGLFYGGKKSEIHGIDLEFQDNEKKYIIALKSGPNWGNSSQQKTMKDDFSAAIQELEHDIPNIDIVSICGCCYGDDNRTAKGGFIYKYCGQKFWHLISGEKDFYIDIIKPFDYMSKEKNQDYNEIYAQKLNSFTKYFTNNYCSDDGIINWPKIVEFNSSIKIRQ